MPVIGGTTIAVYADFYSCWAISRTEIGHHVVYFNSVGQFISTLCNFTNTTYWIRIAFNCYRNIFFIARTWFWTICLLRILIFFRLLRICLVKICGIILVWTGLIIGIILRLRVASLLIYVAFFRGNGILRLDLVLKSCSFFTITWRRSYSTFIAVKSKGHNFFFCNIRFKSN